MKKFLILALSAALLLALFGCGSPKEDDKGIPGVNAPPAGTENFEEIALTLPSPTSPETDTGENGSKMYKYTGEDFTKIKEALPGSYVAVTYKATVTYAVGEIGWIDASNAGPVISGKDDKGKNQTAYYNVEDLLLGTDNFTVHIFNGATLADVTLYAAPPDYDYKGNDKATAGATKIVLPQGHNIIGRGDLSKVDFKKITTAASGTLVFYFDETADTESGILKFGPKKGSPYKHYGIDSDGSIKDESGKGWRVVNSETRTITYTVAEIKAGVTEAGAGFNKLEINNDSSGKEGVLLYLELKP